MSTMDGMEKLSKKVTYIGLKLNNKTDADILSAVGGMDTRQHELKRLVRVGIKELTYRRRKRELKEADRCGGLSK